MLIRAASCIRIACLAITLLFATSHASAVGTVCAPDGKGHLCCATTDVEGGVEMECSEAGDTCASVSAPKQCDFERGSDDYCYCKTLQTCAEACGVIGDETKDMGAAAKDFYDHCGSMIKRYGGDGAMDELKVCRQTDPLSVGKIQDNCKKFVHNYCDKVGAN